MVDQSKSVGEFLDAVAARQPTPGGGSVAAVAGALAAAMGEMVLNYSVGKKGLEAHQEALKQGLAELHRARQMLLQLMVEDQLAFDVLSGLKKLPPEAPERADRLPAAVVACIRVPQTIGATAVAILDVCDRLADRVNVYLLSDLAVCADLAMATVRCAGYNVRINLPDLPDDADRRAVAESVTVLQAHAIALIQRVSPRIWARVDKGS